MSEQRRTKEMHNNYLITAIAIQAVDGARWRSAVEVVTAGGEVLPFREDDDTTYDSAEEALEAALKVGRGLATEGHESPGDT